MRSPNFPCDKVSIKSLSDPVTDENLIKSFDDFLYKYVGSKTLSFIIPFRNRFEHLDGSINTISKICEGLDYEVLIVEQDNNEPFKLGQLCNIGFLMSSGKYIVFLDVDARFINKIDLVNMSINSVKPLLLFNNVCCGTEDSLFKFDTKFTESKIKDFGFARIFTRAQFCESGGFSNLVFGWGVEDSILNLRCGFNRLAGVIMGHVQHDKCVFDESNFIRNINLYNTEETRSKFLDGYKQTTFHINNFAAIGNRATLLSVTNIGVTADFKYKNLMCG